MHHAWLKARLNSSLWQGRGACGASGECYPNLIPSSLSSSMKKIDAIVPEAVVSSANQLGKIGGGGARRRRHGSREDPIVEWFVNVICSKNGITVNGHCIACGVSGDTCNFGWLVQWSRGKRLGIFINGVLVWEETKHGFSFKIEL